MDRFICPTYSYKSLLRIYNMVLRITKWWCILLQNAIRDTIHFFQTIPFLRFDSDDDNCHSVKEDMISNKITTLLK